MLLLVVMRLMVLLLLPDTVCPSTAEVAEVVVHGAVPVPMPVGPAEVWLFAGKKVSAADDDEDEVVTEMTVEVLMTRGTVEVRMLIVEVRVMVPAGGSAKEPPSLKGTDGATPVTVEVMVTYSRIVVVAVAVPQVVSTTEEVAATAASTRGLTTRRASSEREWKLAIVNERIVGKF